MTGLATTDGELVAIGVAISLSLAQLSKNLLDEKPKPDPTSASWCSSHNQIELAPVSHLSARSAILGNV